MRQRNFWLSGLLVLGFVVALGLRVLIGRPQVAQSSLAGLVFAACLVGLSLVVGVRTVWSWRSVWMGLIGGVVLCMPALLAHLLRWHLWASPHGYVPWVLVVSVVAFGEELFLRGALFEVFSKWRSELFAVEASAVLFALLHVPLYGWHVLPLDFGVGLFLGALRLLSGTYIAPAIAHVVADLVGWWVR